jgi:hypothetical protein
MGMGIGGVWFGLDERFDASLERLFEIGILDFKSYRARRSFDVHFEIHLW